MKSQKHENNVSTFLKIVMLGVKPRAYHLGKCSTTDAYL